MGAMVICGDQLSGAMPFHMNRFYNNPVRENSILYKKAKLINQIARQGPGDMIVRHSVAEIINPIKFFTDPIKKLNPFLFGKDRTHQGHHSHLSRAFRL